MYDDNYDLEIDDDFEEYVTDLDAYVEEVNNKEWIDNLIRDIDLD